MQNPFLQKNLRGIYDPVEKKWWFSAVDICAILIGSDCDYARRYWKNLKHDLWQQKNQLVAFSNQLKFPSAKDGKYYHTEVLDTLEVAYLIQVIPHKGATPFRLWLAQLVVAGEKLEPFLIRAGAKHAEEFIAQYRTNPKKYPMHIITKEGLLDRA